MALGRERSRIVSLAGGVMSDHSERKLSHLALSALVVGSMISASVFPPLNVFGAAAGPSGAIIALCIAAGVMDALARVFQVLAVCDPESDAGAYADGCAARRARQRTSIRFRRLPQRHVVERN